MTNYVMDLINRSIGGGRALPESDEPAKPARNGKKALEAAPSEMVQTARPARKESIALSGVFRS
jgi:hypothetical protein